MNYDEEEGAPAEPDKLELAKHIIMMLAALERPSIIAMAGIAGVSAGDVLAAIDEDPRLYLDGDEDNLDECSAYYEDGK